MLDDFNRDQQMALSIIRSITGSISIVASSLIIVMISRSAAKFSTTQNRLLLGLSLSDILFSIATSLSQIPAPRDTPNSWNAIGSTGTCEIQGFLFIFGSLVTPSYNAALCIFYLLKIKYRMPDERIKTKVEPFLHVVPISIALSFCVYFLKKDFINPAPSICFIREYPPNCSSSNSNNPCQRGEGYKRDTGLRLFGIIFLLIPAIIFGSMISLFLAVKSQEQRQARYGRGSLTIDTNNSTPMSTSRQAEEYVRKVMYRGLAYSGSWMITQLVPAIFFIMINFGSSMMFHRALLISLLHPLQGLFNFLVYLYPKVQAERRRSPDLSIWQASVNAFKVNLRGSITPRTTDGAVAEV